MPPTISDQLNQLIAITLQSQANFNNQLAVLIKATKNLNSKLDTLTETIATRDNHITNLCSLISARLAKQPTPPTSKQNRPATFTEPSALLVEFSISNKAPPPSSIHVVPSALLTTHVVSTDPPHLIAQDLPPFPPKLLPTLSYPKQSSCTVIQPTETPTQRPKTKPTPTTATLVAISISRPQRARKLQATTGILAAIKEPRKQADVVTGETILRLSGYRNRPSIWSCEATLGGACGTTKRSEWRPPWRVVESVSNAAGRIEWRPPWRYRSVLEDKNVLRRVGMIRDINDTITYPHKWTHELQHTIPPSLSF